MAENTKELSPLYSGLDNFLIIHWLNVHESENFYVCKKKGAVAFAGNNQDLI